MVAGLRVEIAVSSPGECPVAAASQDTDTSVTDVSRSTKLDPNGRRAEEFSLDDAVTPSSDDLTEIAQYDSETVYRFRRPGDETCVCERIESLGYPVADIQAIDGTLVVTLHVASVNEVRDIVDRLREQFGGVHLRTLTQAGADESRDLTIVDRGHLTNRQMEVLETALRMGYFEHPKGANATEVADALAVTPSTVREHLATAQTKLFDSIIQT